MYATTDLKYDNDSTIVISYEYEIWTTKPQDQAAKGRVIQGHQCKLQIIDGYSRWETSIYVELSCWLRDNAVPVRVVPPMYKGFTESRYKDAKKSTRI